jgi:regulator of sigma E protease
VPWDDADKWRFARESSISSTSPLSVPGLGVAYRIETVLNGEPAAGSVAAKAGLKDGDVIKAIRYHQVDPKTGRSKPSAWYDLEPDGWAFAAYDLQRRNARDVTLRVQQGKETREVDLTGEEDPTWPRDDRGLVLSPDTRVKKADGLVEAVAMGFQDTTTAIVQIYQGLKNMIVGRLPASKNLRGPVFIAEQAFLAASYDVYEFLVFLGIISVNLAVINFLPIPVLDGGHMVFLIYEKLRGKPAPEQVRIGATYVGLFLILGLMLFALYRDIFVS